MHIHFCYKLHIIHTWIFVFKICTPSNTFSLLGVSSKGGWMQHYSNRIFKMEITINISKAVKSKRRIKEMHFHSHTLPQRYPVSLSTCWQIKTTTNRSTSWQKLHFTFLPAAIAQTCIRLRSVLLVFRSPLSFREKKTWCIVSHTIILQSIYQSHGGGAAKCSEYH